MSADPAGRRLFVVRPDDSGFRVVVGSAREAVAHLRRFEDLGFKEARIARADGQNLDIAEVAALVEQEPPGSSAS